MDKKVCSKCKIEKHLSDFNKCKTNKDGYSFHCKSCRQEYNASVKEKKTEYNKKYYKENKEHILQTNAEYRNNNVESIAAQRKEYRSNNSEHIKKKNKEYLPKKKEKIKEKRKVDLNFRVSEILRSKVHKMLKGHNTSYMAFIGCGMEELKEWLEYQFDNDMTWDNLGTYWQIDHVLAINQFDFSKDDDKFVCFNWTNLQPLRKEENREKSDKMLLHYYFNSIITVHRYVQKFKKDATCYQNVRKSLHWLREKLRYGNNATDNNE